MGVLLAFTGVCAGMLVSGGVFALLTKVGIITRMIACTKTADKIEFYERLIVLGGTMGNLVSVFKLPLINSPVFLGIVGVMSGVFTGSLSLALAESINVLPVFLRKLRLDVGIQWIVLAFALGKCLGSFLWFLD